MILRLSLLGLLGLSAVGASAQGAPRANPEARGTLAAFAQCVVASSPARAHSVLTRDFTTTAYRNELKLLSEFNRSCLGGRRGFRASGLPFAGALAEAMLAREASPLNVRLARASSGKPAPTFAPSDAAAMCAVRSAPDQVAALLASPVASGAEFEAAAAVLPALKACARKADVDVDVQPVGLRSIVATASYRLLAAQGAD